MSSLVGNDVILLFGLANLPDNFMIYDDSKQKLWFESLKNQIEREEKQSEFAGISISKENALQIDDKFIKLFEKYFPNKFCVVDVTNTGLFNKEEFAKIAEIKQKLDGKGKLMFSENFSYYNFDNVCTANSKINTWADEINNLRINGRELTPLEKYFVAYSYVTRFDYSESSADLYNSRNLIKVLNGDKIVCVGYAQMLSSLCDRLGIECKVQTIGFDKPELNHMNCQVTIKDSKYGVNGTFYADPCFDSNSRGKTSFSHALISYSDIPKIFVSHWIKFNDEETYNPSNNVSTSGETIEEIKKGLNEFLYSQKEHFSTYIDKCIKDRKNHLITRPASKKEMHDIIDKIIEDYLIKVSYGKMKSHFNAYESKIMDKIAREDLAEMILEHSKKRNIEEFKEKLYKEMKVYLPKFDSYAFNRLADAFVRYNADEKDRQTQESKANAENLTFDEFDKLISNLKNIQGQSEAFDPNKIDEMVVVSTARARKIWGEFRSANNVFSMLSDIFTVKVRDEGISSIESGEHLMSLGRERVKKIEAEKKAREEKENQEVVSEKI
ncbi:MAG: hypothetical protein IJX17_06610 [Clostridia bacterium]|nr:hypothetical protein [Clostridia bacterium]